MNPLYFVLLAALVVKTTYVDTASIQNGQVSGNCEKNLIKRQCSRCGDVCISVDKHHLDKWTSNITNVLISAQGLDIFETYLRACHSRQSVDQLELWRTSNIILPYKSHNNSGTETAESLSKRDETLKQHLFLIKNGKHVPTLKNKLHYIRVLQHNVRNALTVEYMKFQQKLLNDKKELKNYSELLCRNNSSVVNKTN